MSLYLPPFEYTDALVDHRTPRPPHRSDVVLTRPRRRRRLFGRRWR